MSRLKRMRIELGSRFIMVRIKIQTKEPTLVHIHCGLSFLASPGRLGQGPHLFAQSCLRLGPVKLRLDCGTAAEEVIQSCIVANLRSVSSVHLAGTACSWGPPFFEGGAARQVVSHLPLRALAGVWLRLASSSCWKLALGS